MKKLLLMVLAIVVSSLSSFAQIAVCDNPCQAANPETDEFTDGVIPVHPTTVPEFTVGVPVDECITIKIPESISYQSYINVTVDSLELDNFINVPDGLSICTSDTMAYPNQVYTIHLFGTPTTRGTFDLKIVGKAYSESTQAYLLNLVNRLLAQGYSTGINLVVNATGLELPIADFSANRTNVQINETINFTDQSEFDPTSWLWNFGDGTTSTEQNPTHAYAAAGTYSVSLTVENANGSDSETKENYITVEQGVLCVTSVCDPVTDQPFSETEVPYYTRQPLSYDVNTPIDLCVTIRCPETTSGSFGTISSGTTITSITISSLSNLPAGLEYCVSETSLEPGDYATLHIYGTPTQSGEFNIRLDGRYSGSTSFGNQSIPINNQNLSMNTGIVLTITGEGGDEPGGDDDPDEPSELVCETPCPIVTDQPFVETTIPYYTDQTLSYQLNAAMDLCITAKCPETTNVRINLYNDMGVDAEVNVSSINISSLTNLPAGLSYCVSQANLDANDYFSIHIYGTPTEEGDFNINISGIIEGNVTSPISMNVPNTTLAFASGIILHISDNPNAVSADFVASSTTITAGETITFTNLSRNASSYLWTFTGGSPITSTEENPSVTYSEAGIYTVSLRAASSTLGLLTNSDTETKENYIIVTAGSSSDIVVDFEADHTTVQVGTTVHFTNHCSSNASVFEWTFDGGSPSSSTNANPDVTYNTPGVYDVKLKAGTSNILIYVNGVTKTKNGYITVTSDPVEPPQPDEVVANFYAPTSANINEPVTLHNLSQNATSYFWSFEGATPSTSTEENPTIVFARTGRYAITLFVSNGSRSDTRTAYINIEAGAAADFVASATTISAGESVTFTNTSTNATMFYWTFAGGDPSNSTETNPTVTYNVPGTYSVTLFAAGVDSNDTETKAGYIVVLPVTTADFVASATEIYAGDTITFENLSEYANSFFWTFPGGMPESSTDANPVVTYAEAGLYTVSLYATNGYNSDIETKTSYIYVRANTEANFTVENTTVFVGETVAFTNLSTNATSFYWSFEGGAPATSMEENPEVVYMNAGVYNVTLFATNGATSDMESREGYITVVDTTASAAMMEIGDVSVYPNPVSSTLNISAEGMSKVEIIDMLGRIVFEQNVVSDAETFDVSFLAKTSYMVRITTASGVVVRNIIVE